jgi:hypothetical protein
LSRLRELLFAGLQKVTGVEAGEGFPIDRKDERVYDPDWQGVAVTCDIDRTYLATRFSSLSGMARIPFEFGIDKVDIAGMASLLKELRRGPDPRVSRSTPLYFVSASPAQLRPVIERKMLLDGLEYDGTTFKRWGAVLVSGRTARFREQLGYKTTALLMARQALPAGTQDVLIGDDIESDPWAFCAYADVLSGALAGDQARSRLASFGVADDDIERIVELRASLGEVTPVKRVLIRLERGDADRLRPLAPRVRACRGAWQMALSCFDDGEIREVGLLRVGRDLVARGVRSDDLAERLIDAVNRGVTSAQTAQELAPRLVAEGLLPAHVALPAAADPSWLTYADRPTWLD